MRLASVPCGNRVARIVVPGVVLLVLLAPAQSVASTVAMTGNEMTIVAGAGENNQISVSPNGVIAPYDWRILDAVTINAGAGCASMNAPAFHGASCDPGWVLTQTINAALDDGNDQFSFQPQCVVGECPPTMSLPTVVDGGAGNDVITTGAGPSTLTGGSGSDTLTGGPANDTIQARDRTVDTIVCGTGDDTVTSDPEDKVAADCEHVDNGAAISPAGPTGVSINDGAQFTNDPNVTLSMRWPRLAATASLSNDGGFAKAKTVPVAATVPWKLDSSGPERLPKTIYVRFTGGDSGPETYQDDIILDETPPTVSQASAVTTSTARQAWIASLATSKTRTYKLKIKASDKLSGVAKMQISSNKRKPGTLLRYSTRATIRSNKSPLYVRVRDRAGNYSTWRKASR